MKQQIFKLKIYAPRLILVLAAVISCSIITSASTYAHHASDCSDVYTPLSSFVTDGVNRNKSAYVQVMNETGVPWEMLAAIHYRETNFSRNNPSNGQGIFQFVNGDGGPYPPGPVSDGEFTRQLRFMANRIQNDYVNRGSVPRERRKLVPGETNIAIVKDTLFSYNGRASAYIDQAAHFGYDTNTQPYEGSPYVMNRFDCPRARMGIITRDYGAGIDGTDTRYGAFTVYARLKGDAYWRALTLPYAWQVISQGAYTDSTKTQSVNHAALAKGQRFYLVVKARNIGNTTWTNSGSNPVNLATSNDRVSQFRDSTWLSGNRPTRLLESSVPPGSIGTFAFWAKAPSSFGTYNEYFLPVAEGKAWMNDVGMYWPLTVKPDTYSWVYVGQRLFTDSARTKPVDSITSPNTTYYVRVQAKNNGNVTWQRGNLNLGTTNPIDRTSQFRDSSWISGNRAATLKEASVAPGETGTFEFSIRTPSTAGTYHEYFRPVAEGKGWLNDVGLYLPIRVMPPSYYWQYQGQSVYTGSDKQTAADTKNVASKSRLYAVLRARNTGNTTWQRGNVNLATTSPGDRTSQFRDSSWISGNRAATLKEASVAPGETGTFELWFNAPYAVNGATFNEYFSPVAEGKAWMNDLGQHWALKMNSPNYVWEYAGQNVFTDSNRTNPVGGTLSKNTTYYLRLKAKNISGQVWQRGNLNLGTTNPIDRTSQFRDSSWISGNRAATLKEASVAPGETGTFEFSIRTPSTAGTYHEYFRPVAEGKGWLNDVGLYWNLVVQ